MWRLAKGIVLGAKTYADAYLYQLARAQGLLIDEEQVEEERLDCKY